MTGTKIDLAQIFATVAQNLEQNKERLNTADTYNNDHGDHMVQTFQTITKAMREKTNAPQSEALSHAANVLKQNAPGNSGQLYADGLQQAAKQFQGGQITTQDAVQLLQTLLGGGQSKPIQSHDQQSTNPPGGGLLGSLLGGLLSKGQSQQQQQGGLSDGLDMGDLITAGTAYLQAKQQGQSGMDALINAVTSVSGMGSSPHRQQSTQLVAQSFLDALGKSSK